MSHNVGSSCSFVFVSFCSFVIYPWVGRVVCNTLVVVICLRACHNIRECFWNVILLALFRAARLGIFLVCGLVPLNILLANTACTRRWGLCAFSSILHASAWFKSDGVPPSAPAPVMQIVSLLLLSRLKNDWYWTEKQGGLNNRCQ